MRAATSGGGCSCRSRASQAVTLAAITALVGLWCPPWIAAAQSSPAAAAAAGSDAVWDEAAGLQVILGDSLDAGARIFDSPDYQQQLLVPSKGDQLFLLNLKAQTVQTLSRTALRWNSDQKPVPDVSGGTDAGKYTTDSGVISFNSGGQSWKIQPEPPLIGHVTLEALRESKPDYVYAASKFNPDPAAVKALKSVNSEVHVVVFFGTWCTYCKHWLPQFLKTIQVVDNPKITTEFYGMSEDQLEPKDAIQKYSISSTPTFVVVRDGKELGRIVENPQTSVEGDLAEIIAGH